MTRRAKPRVGRIAALITLAAVLFSPVTARATAQGGLVERILVLTPTAGLEIRILARGFTDAFLFTLEGPNRIILDVYGADRTTAAPTMAVEKAGVSRIRSSQYEAGVVRIVIDVASPWPTYSMKRSPEGFVFFFPADLPGPPAVDVTAPAAKPAEKKAAAETPPIQVLAQAVAPPPDKKTVIETVPPVVKSAPQKAVPKEVKPAPVPPAVSGLPIRVLATAGLVSPRDALLSDRYGNGAGFGAEAGFGLWPFAEAWIAFDRFAGTGIDGVTGQERTLGINVPAAGLRFRPMRGFLSPYVAAGVAYVLYTESSGSLETKANGLGFAASAGFTIQIGRLQVDACARYLRCPLNPAGREFDAGGFRLGGGLGWRF
jgi:hypothetical protein